MTIEKRERCGGTEGKTKPIQRGTITAFSGYAPCPGCHSCDPQNWCACGERLQADPDNYYHPFRPKPHASGTPLREECKEQALRDAGGEDVPRDDSAASSTPSRCPTCGSVDGVPLLLGDESYCDVNVHGGWHERRVNCDVLPTCTPCPTCSAPKQEQPKAGLDMSPLAMIRRMLQAAEYGVQEKRMAHYLNYREACRIAESALGENRKLHERIEALESREEALKKNLCEADTKLMTAFKALLESNLGPYIRIVLRELIKE